MLNLIELDIVLHRDGQRLALEGNYWPALLRLIEVYGLEPILYSAPPEGECALVSEDTAERLVACLIKSLDDIPDEDLWENYEGDPDPFTTPPHVFFSVTCESYLTDVIDFAERGAFSIEVAEPI